MVAKRHQRRRTAFVGSDSTLMGVSRAEYGEAVGRTRTRARGSRRARSARRAARVRDGDARRRATATRDAERGRSFPRATAPRARDAPASRPWTRVKSIVSASTTTRGDDFVDAAARARRGGANRRRATLGVGRRERVDGRRRETRARWCARATASMVVSTTLGDAARALAKRRVDEDAETFERRVRALYGGETRDGIPGQCVLDVDARNILTFEQGRWDLVRRDVVGVFGSRLGGAVAEFVDRAGAVSDAFGTRRNCVNLKKVLLHSQYEIEALEMRLRRLMTFYRGDFGQASGYVDAARYREICAARGRCLGAAKAIFDGRVFTKQICCVPRHPDMSRPRRLASMPRSLVTHGYVGKAAAAAARIGGAESSSDAVEDSLKDSTVASTSAMDPRATPPALTKDFEHIMTRVREELNLPAHYVRFIELSLIARGATKALWIRAELREFLALRE